MSPCGPSARLWPRPARSRSSLAWAFSGWALHIKSARPDDSLSQGWAKRTSLGHGSKPRPKRLSDSTSGPVAGTATQSTGSQPVAQTADHAPSTREAELIGAGGRGAEPAARVAEHHCRPCARHRGWQPLTLRALSMPSCRALDLGACAARDDRLGRPRCPRPTPMQPHPVGVRPGHERPRRCCYSTEFRSSRRSCWAPAPSWRSGSRRVPGRGAVVVEQRALSVV